MSPPDHYEFQLIYTPQVRDSCTTNDLLVVFKSYRSGHYQDLEMPPRESKKLILRLIADINRYHVRNILLSGYYVHINTSRGWIRMGDEYSKNVLLHNKGKANWYNILNTNVSLFKCLLYQENGRDASRRLLRK